MKQEVGLCKRGKNCVETVEECTREVEISIFANPTRTSYVEEKFERLRARALHANELNFHWSKRYLYAENVPEKVTTRIISDGPSAHHIFLSEHFSQHKTKSEDIIKPQEAESPL